MMTTVDVTERAPLTHADAMQLQQVELDRTLEVLRQLTPEQWRAQTDCPAWDVHHMYLHVLGACEASASMRENLHQMVAAKRHQRRNGGPLEAGLSHVQVQDRAHLSPDGLIEQLTEIAPVTVRKRTKMPAVMRRARMSVDGPVIEKWRLGYLIDTIYLRDAWMHRVDLSGATGREMDLRPDHDGRIVADVVAEWARRHGRPFTLVLHGVAGGTYRSTGRAEAATEDEDGDIDGPVIELDAVEFCRIHAGRVPAPHPLFDTIVPF